MTLQTRAPPNRFLTQYHWDEDELNQRRLELLQSMKETQWHRNGVVAIDDTLLSKTGEEIPGAEKFWDHNSNSYLYGQSLVTSHYIDLDKDYPIDFRQYFKQGSLEAVKYGFRTKVDLALELVDYCEALGIPVETYVFDAWFLCKKLTNHIESYEKSWVGRLKVEPHRSTTRTKG
ncbi:MAG: transposase [Candidatus Freyarchaeota archaeon]